MKSSVNLTGLIALFIMLLASSLNMTAADLNSASELVNENSKALVALIQNENNNATPDRATLETKVLGVLKPLISFSSIARGVMGKYYKSATAAQQKRFAAAFQQSLVQILTQAISSVQVKNIEVQPAQPGKTSTKAIVNMKIQTGANSFNFIYSMAINKSGNWKVRNLIVNGINLGMAYRNQFYGAIDAHKGNINAVIDSWKVNKVKSPAG